jgi:hypothetical protein
MYLQESLKKIMRIRRIIDEKDIFQELDEFHKRIMEWIKNPIIAKRKSLSVKKKEKKEKK